MTIERNSISLGSSKAQVTFLELTINSRVVLDPSQTFTVSALNSINDDEKENGEISVFGKVNVLQPQDSR